MPSLREQAKEALAEKDLEKALELFTRAVEESEDAQTLAERAAVHNRLKNHIEAAADASRAAELDPALVAAYQQQGHALYALEEFESAKDAFEQAAALEPSKRIHKQWVEMCKAQLGEELEPPPPAPALSPPAARTTPPQPSTSAPAAGGGAGGSGGGQSITLSGDELKRFLAGQQLQAQAAQAAKAREEAEEAQTSTQPRHATLDDPEFSKYWSHAISPELVAALPDKPAGKYRHQWFQGPDKVEVDVLAKGLKAEQVSVSMEPQRLVVGISSPDGQPEYSLDLALAGTILPQDSKFSVLSTKVEIRLKKAQPGEQWPALEVGTGGAAVVPTPAAPATADPGNKPAAGPPAYPYAGKRVDWDQLEQQLKREEKEEKLEGDAALNKFFKDIYEQGDEDMRRAMVKSMQESGGTALSTNWKEVGTKTYKPGSDDK